MTWITNHPKSLTGLWPRRAGCEYIQGEPMGTETYTSEQLKAEGYVGAYVDMPEAEYRKLPLVRTPQELRNFQK